MCWYFVFPRIAGQLDINRTFGYLLWFGVGFPVFLHTPFAGTIRAAWKLHPFVEWIVQCANVCDLCGSVHRQLSRPMPVQSFDFRAIGSAGFCHGVVEQFLQRLLFTSSAGWLRRSVVVGKRWPGIDHHTRNTIVLPYIYGWRSTRCDHDCNSQEK